MISSLLGMRQFLPSLFRWGGDGLSAGGDTVCQESDGVGLTAFGSVFQSLGGRQVGGVLFLIGVYNRRKIATGQI